MKSAACTALILSAAILCNPCPAVACGPFNPIIPTPEYFNLSTGMDSELQMQYKENIRLWQQLTSDKIPERDIYDVVYTDSHDVELYIFNDDNSSPKNLFITYILNSKDYEISDFLHTAKGIADKRREIASPWYFPASNKDCYAFDDFSYLINTCKAYSGTRLRDRYALQAIRAMFASRDYAGCIEYFDDTLAKFPDDNLFKNMARGYVAGCWSRLGDKNKADSIFAMAGDIHSITDTLQVEYMARLNPNHPSFIRYISDISKNSCRFTAAIPAIQELISSGRAKHPGDWQLALAFYYGNTLKEISKARAHIKRACASAFSSTEIADQARIYRMKLDAMAGDQTSLYADIRWLKTKTDIFSKDYVMWNRYAGNIIYENWIPKLWAKGDYSKAILLSAFADNDKSGSTLFYDWKTSPTVANTLEEIRKSELDFNYVDYSSLTFQLMYSLSSAQLADTYTKIMASSPLNNMLRPYARTDKDYFNELIGTIALREQNYDRAIFYLNQVSPAYQRTLNVYKHDYLSRDPFALVRTKADPDNMKLNFAREMRHYRHEMKNARTPDERGKARMMYAIGLHNSTGTCWALTRYSDGYLEHAFEPCLTYWNNDDNPDYSFLVNNEPSRTDELMFTAELAAARAMMTSDEARAEAEYYLGNLKSVIKFYPYTATASRIRTSCDNWRQWF